MGVTCYPMTPEKLGGVPRVQGVYNDLSYMQPQRPLRAMASLTGSLPPVLYHRGDQLVLLNNALAHRRVERQVSVLLSQLALGMRNAEHFLTCHVLDKEVRPSIHTIWFHEDGGLRGHMHLLSGLAAHHLVPLFSLISYDVERGKMTAFEAEELYEELMDCSVAQPKMVQRELANQMIRVHCLHDDYDKAMDVIDEMTARRIRRTFVSYAPLFRLIRAKSDADAQVRLLRHMYQVEGGRLCKCIFIDLPRMMYMFGVFIRFNWIFIHTCCVTAITLVGITTYEGIF